MNTKGEPNHPSSTERKKWETETGGERRHRPKDSLLVGRGTKSCEKEGSSSPFPLKGGRRAQIICHWGKRGEGGEIGGNVSRTAEKRR